MPTPTFTSLVWPSLLNFLHIMLVKKKKKKSESHSNSGRMCKFENLDTLVKSSTLQSKIWQAVTITEHKFIIFTEYVP